jgi:hypothetical protein
MPSAAAGESDDETRSAFRREQKLPLRRVMEPIAWMLSDGEGCAFPHPNPLRRTP